MRFLAYALIVTVIGLLAGAIITSTHTTLSDKLLDGALLAIFGSAFTFTILKALEQEGK